MTSFFESINPDGEPDDTPEVDETYWPRNARNLWPYEVVHPESDSNLGMDNKTKKLYLNGSNQYTSRDHEPGFDYTGRIGVMRVYQLGADGEIIDGHLVDIRAMDPRDLRAYDLPDVGVLHNGKKPENDLIPVLGHIYFDAEGSLSFRGDRELEEAAWYLTEMVDAVFWKDSTTELELQADEGLAHDEESAPVTDKDL